MGRKRYVIRLHKLIRERVDELAKKEGYLTATYISNLLEEICKDLDVESYEIHPDSQVFLISRKKQYKNEVKIYRDKQMSVYLSDEAYNKISQLTQYLKENVDRTCNISYVVRDLIMHGIAGERT